MSGQTTPLVERLRSLADCDARAGEPLGKCMREAADTINDLLEACERMVAATEADQHFIGAEHDALKAAIAKARGEA